VGLSNVQRDEREADARQRPSQGDSVPLFNPRLQKWPDHFRWSEDNLRVIGRTPTGRATVRALRMNRHGVARVRTYLIARGVHPPPPA